MSLLAVELFLGAIACSSSLDPCLCPYVRLRVSNVRRPCSRLAHATRVRASRQALFHAVPASRSLLCFSYLRTYGAPPQLAHRSFKSPKWLEYLAAYCGAMAMQVDTRPLLDAACWMPPALRRAQMSVSPLDLRSGSPFASWLHR
eukprot:6211744-Pleurochrysis_carterae.AAC.2